MVPEQMWIQICAMGIDSVDKNKDYAKDMYEHLQNTRKSNTCC